MGLYTRTSLHCAPRLTHSSGLKIHLACRLRPRHREDAYIVIRYMSPAPPIITYITPCSTIRRLIVWKVKMARIRRTVEVHITAVSLLFSYNTNIFQILSISYVWYGYAIPELPTILLVVLTLNIIITEF